MSCTWINLWGRAILARPPTMTGLNGAEWLNDSVKLMRLQKALAAWFARDRLAHEQKNCKQCWSDSTEKFYPYWVRHLSFYLSFPLPGLTAEMAEKVGNAVQNQKLNVTLTRVNTVNLLCGVKRHPKANFSVHLWTRFLSCRVNEVFSALSSKRCRRNAQNT